MTYQEIIKRLEGIEAALRSEVEEAEDSRLFTGRFVGCIETVLALLADLKAVEVLNERPWRATPDDPFYFHGNSCTCGACVPVHITVTRREP